MMMKPSEIGGLFSYGRVVVVGANGAGKTYVARRIADRLDLPLLHNDALALTTNWQKRPKADVQAARDAIAAQPRWVIEGGPSVLSNAIMGRAEAIVWIDLPRGLRTWRVLRRTLKYIGRQRPEHPDGNREWPGRRQCRFLVKTWTTHDAMCQTIRDRITAEDPRLIHLTSRVQVSRFLH